MTMRKRYIVLGVAWFIVLLIVVIGGWFSVEETINPKSSLVDQEDVLYTSNWVEPGPSDVVKHFFEYVRLSRYMEAIEYFGPTTRMLDFPNKDQDPAVLHERIRQVFSYFNRGWAGQLEGVNILDEHYIDDRSVVVRVELVYHRTVLEREIELTKNATEHDEEEEQWSIKTSIYRILGDLMG